MNDSAKEKDDSLRVSKVVAFIPAVIVVLLCIVITLFPNNFEVGLGNVQDILVNKCDFIFIILNWACTIFALYVALSKYGKIKIGNIDKPRYSTFSWVGLIFTSTMAADMLYWAMIEWIYYYQGSPFGVDPAERSLSETRDYISSYSLFHWGPMSWIYFILPAAIFGFMVFVKKRSNESISEACRPVLGNRVDGWVGTLIDFFCVLACILSCPIFIRIGTPVISALVAYLFGLSDSALLQIIIIVIIAVIYTAATVIGMRAIKILSDTGMWLYIVLCLVFFVFGPILYTVDSAITSIGFVLQHYFTMSTWLDPLRLTAATAGGMGFPQTWTVFFNANWLVSIAAVPFFIAKISEGRTLRNTILGGMLAGVGATYFSFIIMGNYSIFQQLTGVADYAAMADAGYSTAQIIAEIIKTLPMAQIVMFLVILTMIALFVTTFDANCLMLACFSQRHRKLGQEPSTGMRLFFAIFIALTPIAMTIANTSLSQLQTIQVTISYPMVVCLIIMMFAFKKDLNHMDMSTYDPKVGVDPHIFDDDYFDPVPKKLKTDKQ